LTVIDFTIIYAVPKDDNPGGKSWWEKSAVLDREWDDQHYMV